MTSGSLRGAVPNNYMYISIHVCSGLLLGMSKRVRKVAFADEVQVEEDKRRREDNAEEQEDSGGEERKELSECALIGTQR